MTRSLDFTACTKQDCHVKDCFRKLTKEEKDWLEKTPNRMAWADCWKNCQKLKEEFVTTDEMIKMIKELDK